MTSHGTARMIRIHIGDDDRWEGRPLRDAIVDEAHRQQMAGAIVYRGIESYGASSRIHRKHLLTSDDLPIVICLIDERAKIEGFLPTLERMVSEGLIAVSDVETFRYTPSGDDDHGEPQP